MARCNATETGRPRYDWATETGRPRYLAGPGRRRRAPPRPGAARARRRGGQRRGRRLGARGARLARRAAAAPPPACEIVFYTYAEALACCAPAPVPERPAPEAPRAAAAAPAPALAPKRPAPEAPRAVAAAAAADPPAPLPAKAPGAEWVSARQPRLGANGLKRTITAEVLPSLRPREWLHGNVRAEYGEVLVEVVSASAGAVVTVALSIDKTGPKYFFDRCGLKNLHRHLPAAFLGGNVLRLARAANFKGNAWLGVAYVYSDAAAAARKIERNAAVERKSSIERAALAAPAPR